MQRKWYDMALRAVAIPMLYWVALGPWVDMTTELLPHSQTAVAVTFAIILGYQWGKAGELARKVAGLHKIKTLIDAQAAVIERNELEAEVEAELIERIENGDAERAAKPRDHPN